MSRSKGTTSKQPTAVLRERLYVPSRFVNDEMRAAWTYVVPDPDPDGDPDVPLQVELWREHNDGKETSFARGDMGKVARFFGRKAGFKVKDRRAAPPMEYPITMLTTLFTPETDSQGRNQQEVVQQWMSKKYGQIKAPARFGKTITVTDIICRLGVKTLILCHQWDILTQFEKTIREHTDVNEAEKIAGRKLVGRLDKIGWDNIDDVEILLSTWQSWHHPSKKEYLKKHRDTFGAVFVDESHLSQAVCYAKVVDSFNAKYRCGNSATPEKENLLHVVINNILGPVVTAGKSMQMHCEVYFKDTGFGVSDFRATDPRHAHAKFLKQIVGSRSRNKKIVEEAVKDANAGRYILITTERTSHARELSDMLNKAGITTTYVVGETSERDQVWERCRTGEIQCLVAMRRITRLGIDVPKWDCFYNIIPARDKNNHYQEISRVRTWYEGKPVPIIKDWIDYPRPDSLPGGTAKIYGTMKRRMDVYKEQGFDILETVSESRAEQKFSFVGRKKKRKS